MNLSSLELHYAETNKEHNNEKYTNKSKGFKVDCVLTTGMNKATKTHQGRCLVPVSEHTTSIATLLPTKGYGTLLDLPRANWAAGASSFKFAAAKNWNSLPKNLRMLKSIFFKILIIIYTTVLFDDHFELRVYLALYQFVYVVCICYCWSPVHTS